METKVFLEELCGGCGGCSEMPARIEDLCSNPLEKYLYRMRETESEAYFRGRRDGSTILEANVEQAHKAGIEKVGEWIKTCYITNEHCCYCIPKRVLDKIGSRTGG